MVVVNLLVAFPDETFKRLFKCYFGLIDSVFSDLCKQHENYDLKPQNYFTATLAKFLLYRSVFMVYIYTNRRNDQSGSDL